MARSLRLTKAERRVWNAFPTGEMVEFADVKPGSTRTAGVNAPKDGDTWGPERTVRAEVIAKLLLGAREAGAGAVPAVRVSGARITGALQIFGGTVEHELVLSGCHLEGPVRLTDCRTRTVRLTDCRLPSFGGVGMRVEGHLSLSGSHVTGPVQVMRAQFATGLWLAGTKVEHPHETEPALQGTAMIVDSVAYLGNADITGMTRLAGARLNGGLSLTGAKLRNPGRLALDADGMVVEEALRCTGDFLSLGCVRLRGSRVNGLLAIRGVIRSPDTPYALHASHMEVREFYLKPDEPIDGVVTLAHSTVGTLQDSPDTWPERLRLNGLTYERLRGSGVARRIDWVSRDPEGFRPQPYEQLVAWYRRDGNEALARRAQLAKLRNRRRTEGLGGRLWGRLLDFTVGYGYRPWLAAVWFGILLVIGTVVFGLNPPRAVKPDEAPGFDPFAYTFDLLLPWSAFGQRDMFDPAGWTQALAYGLVVAGWILATALIAGATRVLRPT
ncbi:MULTISPECIES: hypothetical protein [Nonomuraea]|uniref:Membrane-associated oxidoreductase n=1 Tax=Nonomuraea ferruginea TaxID=46174 RepID=A0ABT4T466_9ACTN|nr:hypothetical protein [Nonomuraea ferruginea]MDA0644289.1 hypothetical protein [Nonomuraea ferruginea]